MAFPTSHTFKFRTHGDQHPLPSLPPTNFHRPAPMMMKRSVPFSGMDNSCNEEVLYGDDGLSDDGSQLGEKKKRLNIEQVKALEKSFELGNKLEPERKNQLAEGLGLHPRQIAIWFQNRRARWKTKQLEKDYEILKRQFDALMADNDALLSQNAKLHAELTALKGSNDVSSKASGLVNLINKETDQGRSNGSDQNSCDINLGISSCKNLFPSSSLGTSTTIINHSHKIEDDHDHHDQVLQQDDNQTFSNMFNTMEDHEQQGFWPWSDHHHHFN